MADAVCPGDKLNSTEEAVAGCGTYVKDGWIFSSLSGHRRVVSNEKGQLPTIEVIRSGHKPSVPAAGDLVTVKITRVNPRLAAAEILCVGTKPLEDGFAGIIRVQDVRATEIDKVDIVSCFRPGDVVRAEVISLGDSRSYYLSTAKNELGVVYAKSVVGAPMVPISWTEMQCPETKSIEKRKVAKTEA